MNVLAISGSLRAVSSNTAVLHAAVLVAPPPMRVTLYTGLDTLPWFNPDRDGDDDIPAPVAALRREVGAADGVLISSPEYAHAIPGALKNALEWLVRSPAMVGKPVALLNTSLMAAVAQAQLVDVLGTMSARVVPAACLTVPVSGRPRTPDEIATNGEYASPLRAALRAFASAIEGGSA